MASLSAGRYAVEVQDGVDEALESEAAVTWEGVIGVEGELTGDGRFIQPGALRWENLPIPLRYVSADVGAHSGAVVVGRILEVSRNEETGQIMAKGDFDTESQFGREAARQVQKDLMRGVSMDLDDVAFEVRIAADAAALVDQDAAALVSQGEPDEDGRVKVQEMAPDDEVMVTTSARVRAATIVAVPAFSTAQINALVAGGGEVLETLALKIGGGQVTAEYSPTDQFNWVDDVGGLPKYIKKIADAVQKETGKSEGNSIAIAVNACKKMCKTGDLNFPGDQDVNPGSKAKACKAIEEWEAKKAEAKADNDKHSTDGTSMATSGTATFAGDSYKKQWRNPADGRWIDMPLTAIGKFIDTIKDLDAESEFIDLGDANSAKRRMKDSAAERPRTSEIKKDPGRDRGHRDRPPREPAPQRARRGAGEPGVPGHRRGVRRLRGELHPGRVDRHRCQRHPRGGYPGRHRARHGEGARARQDARQRRRRLALRRGRVRQALPAGRHAREEVFDPPVEVDRGRGAAGGVPQAGRAGQGLHRGRRLPACPRGRLPRRHDRGHREPVRPFRWRPCVRPSSSSRSRRWSSRRAPSAASRSTTSPRPGRTGTRRTTERNDPMYTFLMAMGRGNTTTEAWDRVVSKYGKDAEPTATEPKMGTAPGDIPIPDGGIPSPVSMDPREIEARADEEAALVARYRDLVEIGGRNGEGRSAAEQEEVEEIEDELARRGIAPASVNPALDGTRPEEQPFPRCCWRPRTWPGRSPSTRRCRSRRPVRSRASSARVLGPAVVLRWPTL